MGYALSAACKAAATTCCICGAALVDAESVEHGIGPVCSRNYLGRKIHSSPEQLWEAAALLQAAPQHIQEAAAARMALPDAGRAVANLLIYWFSSRYEESPLEVLALTPALRALGYGDCASKLEGNLTAVRVDTVGGRLEVVSPYNEAFIASVKAIAGRVPVWDPSRRSRTGGPVFKCWAVPVSQRPALAVALARHYPGRVGIQDGVPFEIGRV